MTRSEEKKESKKQSHERCINNIQCHKSCLNSILYCNCYLLLEVTFSQTVVSFFCTLNLMLPIDIFGVTNNSLCSYSEVTKLLN